MTVEEAQQEIARLEGEVGKALKQTERWKTLGDSVQADDEQRKIHTATFAAKYGLKPPPEDQGGWPSEHHTWYQLAYRFGQRVDELLARAEQAETELATYHALVRRALTEWADEFQQGGKFAHAALFLGDSCIVDGGKWLAARVEQAERERDALKAVHEEWRTQWQDAVRLRDGAVAERDFWKAECEAAKESRDAACHERDAHAEAANQSEDNNQRLKDELTSVNEQLTYAQEQLQKATYEWIAADRDNARLRGITPEFPPRPPNGEGLPRYGIRHNGPTEPLAVPMDDGYWTPWHLAEQAERERDDLRAQELWSRKRGDDEWNARQQTEADNARLRAALEEAYGEVQIARDELVGDIDQRAIERETGVVIPAIDRVIARLSDITPTPPTAECQHVYARRWQESLGHDSPGVLVCIHCGQPPTADPEGT